jgi:hypothetical protein
MDKMKMYCESIENNISIPDIIRNDKEIKLFYDKLGAKKIKALGYGRKRIKEAYDAIIMEVEVEKAIRSKFTKDLYTAKEAKEKLKEIYAELGINVKVTAKEIEKFGFKNEVKRINGVVTKVFTK